MFRFGVVTLFPQMFEAVTRYGITGRTIANGLLELVFRDPRDFTKNKHRTVDDRPYGGGPGMVMMAGPLRCAIRSARQMVGAESHVIYLSPQGRRFDQAGVMELAQRKHLVFVAGRYEGIDTRVIESDIDEEWSVGDYVLSGGELAAMVIIDALTRMIPGSLGHDESAREDSFWNGLLDYPHYTRPEEIDGQRVPEILLSGDHQAIQRWRDTQALGNTWLKRPDLLEKNDLDEKQKKLLMEFIDKYQEASE